MTSGQNDDIWDTSLPFAHETAACDRSTWTATGAEWTSVPSGWKFYINVNKPVVCDQTRSTATNPVWTASWSWTRREEQRGVFRYYPRADPSISVNKKPFVESDEMKSRSQGTLNSVDIQSALTEGLVPISVIGAISGTYQSLLNQSQHYPNIKSMKEIVNVVRSYVIALICTLLKAVLAYSLVLRSNLSCVQRTYVGLWRPNEHCDY